MLRGDSSRQPTLCHCTACVPHPALSEGQLCDPITAVVLKAKPVLESRGPAQDSSPMPAVSPVPELVRHRCGISLNCSRLDVHSRSPRDPRYLQQTCAGQLGLIPGLGGGRWSPGSPGQRGQSPHPGLVAGGASAALRGIPTRDLPGTSWGKPRRSQRPVIQRKGEALPTLGRSPLGGQRSESAQPRRSRTDNAVGTQRNPGRTSRCRTRAAREPESRFWRMRLRSGRAEGGGRPFPIPHP